MAKRIVFFGAAVLLFGAGCVKDYDFNNPMDPENPGFRPPKGLAVRSTVPGSLGQGFGTPLATFNSELYFNIFNALPDSIDIAGEECQITIHSPIIQMPGVDANTLDQIRSQLFQVDPGYGFGANFSPGDSFHLGRFNAQGDTLKIGFATAFPSGGYPSGFMFFIDAGVVFKFPVTVETYAYGGKDGGDNPIRILFLEDTLSFRPRLSPAVLPATAFQAADSLSIPVPRSALLAWMLNGDVQAFDTAAFHPDSIQWSMGQFDYLQIALRAKFALAALGDTLFALGGVTDAGNPASNNNVAIDFSTGHFTALTAMPSQALSPSAVTLNGQIYVMGGEGIGGAGRLGRTVAYDPGSGVWSLRDSLLFSRKDFAAVALNGKIYAFGGIGQDSAAADTFLTVVEEYDPLLNQWTVKDTLVPPRAGLGAAVVNGTIYLMGGRVRKTNCCGDSAIHRVDAYDPLSGQWTARAPLEMARSHFGTAVIQGKIYVVGGDSGNNYQSDSLLKTVEEYDPLLNQWTYKAPMPADRINFGVAVVRDTLRVLGGNVFVNANQITGVIDQYDPAADRWNRTVPLRQGNFAGSSLSTLTIGNNFGLFSSPDPYLISEKNIVNTILGHTNGSPDFRLTLLDLTVFAGKNRISVAFPLVFHLK